MDARVNRLNKELRKYDRDLFVERDSSFGVIHVYRHKPRFKVFEYDGSTFAHSFNEKQYIMSLTSDWKASSHGVDWGIEPFMRRISEIDSHRDDSGYEEFCRKRELAEKWKKEAQRNHHRAVAADMRKDFAKAFNDVVVPADQHKQTIF